MHRTSPIVLLVLLLAMSSATVGAAPAGATVPDTRFQRVQLDASDRSRGVRTLSRPVDLVGASWLGPAPSIEVRTAKRGGSFGRWHRLEAEREEGPDKGTREARVVDRRHVASAPVWAPGTVRVQVRGGGARDIRLLLVTSRPTSDELARTGTSRATTSARTTGPPRIQRRAAWGARAAAAPPWYADRLLATVVHHTDTANGYSCRSVPAILRGIQRYHIDGNGWNDIGYNFLVDRCGGVWEGRGGGLNRPVGGAHTAGFNTSTAGIALIGVHSAATPSAAAQRSLVRTISWRMDVAHRSPALRAGLVAASNAEGFQAGQVVLTRAVSGHRDLYPTACPGYIGYRSINRWRVAAWREGGPKVANVNLRPRLDRVTRAITGGTLTAIANGPRDRYRITLIRTSTGQVLRTWRRAPGTLRLELPAMPRHGAASDLTIEVAALRGASLASRPWRSVVAGYGPDPGFTLTREPLASVTPDGDGVDDRITAGFTLTSRRQFTADLLDPATGAVVTTLESAVLAGITAERVRSWAVPDAVADGAYTLRLGVPFDEPGRSWEERAVTIDRTP